MKLPVIKTMVLMTMLINACSEPAKQPVRDEKDTNEYIPVTDYIKSEINTVDSLPGGILKRGSRGGKSDSAFITSAEFNRLAAEFLPKELGKDTFRKSFS